MPNVTGGRGNFGGSGTAGRTSSHTGTGRSSAERAAAADRERRGGFTSGVGQDGRPTFTSTSGLSRGITVSPTQDKMQQNRDRAATYNAAAGKWNNSAKQRSFANFLNAASPMGLSMEAPDLARPATFSGGDYHLGWNPGSLVGLATGAVLPGSGLVTGPLGQMAYSAMGGKNLILGGEGDMGMPSWGAPGTGNAPNPTGPMTPGGGQLAGTTEGGSQIASAPGGAAFGAQPMQPPQQPGTMFSPKIPNHSLPFGFNSAFPNSLSEEDKALLYAKALGGGMG